jgi:hypothetical protein
MIPTEAIVIVSTFGTRLVPRSMMAATPVPVATITSAVRSLLACNEFPQQVIDGFPESLHTGDCHDRDERHQQSVLHEILPVVTPDPAAERLYD